MNAINKSISERENNENDIQFDISDKGDKKIWGSLKYFDRVQPLAWLYMDYTSKSKNDFFFYSTAEVSVRIGKVEEDLKYLMTKLSSDMPSFHSDVQTRMTEVVKDSTDINELDIIEKVAESPYIKSMKKTATRLSKRIVMDKSANEEDICKTTLWMECYVSKDNLNN